VEAGGNGNVHASKESEVSCGNKEKCVCTYEKQHGKLLEAIVNSFTHNKVTIHCMKNRFL
jgi:hypothetical protein